MVGENRKENIFLREYCRPGLSTGGISYISSLMRIGVNCACEVGVHLSTGSVIICHIIPGLYLNL